MTGKGNFKLTYPKQTTNLTARLSGQLTLRCRPPRNLITHIVMAIQTLSVMDGPDPLIRKIAFFSATVTPALFGFPLISGSFFETMEAALILAFTFLLNLFFAFAITIAAGDTAIIAVRKSVLGTQEVLLHSLSPLTYSKVGMVDTRFSCRSLSARAE